MDARDRAPRVSSTTPRRWFAAAGGGVRFRVVSPPATISITRSFAGATAASAVVSERSAVMPIPVTTTFTIEGYRIVRYLGVVRGIIVRAPTIAQGIAGGLKSIIGGRIGAFTEMCEQTRQQAYELMLDHAVSLGANAIVGLRYDASDIGGARSHATEVLCYGTAVVIEAES